MKAPATKWVQRFFPRRFDNGYLGNRLAPWLLALVLLMKLAISLNSIFNGDVVARSADGISLDTFTPGGAQAVVSLFALLGLSQLMICLLGILVLVRYRTMVPLMFALILLEHLGKRLILHFQPIARTGSPPGSVINLALLAVMLVGLALSLRRQDRLQAEGGRLS